MPIAERRNGRRQYDPAILDRLATIGLAKSAGFTLAEIRALLLKGDDPRSSWKRLIDAKFEELDRAAMRLSLTRQILQAIAA